LAVHERSIKSIKKYKTEEEASSLYDCARWQTNTKRRSRNARERYHDKLVDGRNIQDMCIKEIILKSKNIIRRARWRKFTRMQDQNKLRSSVLKSDEKGRWNREPKLQFWEFFCTLSN
jgi:hypothetical protein